MTEFKVNFELTREKAINMIVGYNSFQTYEFDIDCDCSESELEQKFSEMEWSDLDCFRRECFIVRKELEEERKRLNTLPTHEIYEEGEKMELWKLNEKQKRLV